MVNYITMVVLLTTIYVEYLRVTGLSSQDSKGCVYINVFTVVFTRVVMGVNVYASIAPIVNMALPFFDTNNASLLYLFLKVSLIRGICVGEGSEAVGLHSWGWDSSFRRLCFCNVLKFLVHVWSILGLMWGYQLKYESSLFSGAAFSLLGLVV